MKLQTKTHLNRGFTITELLVVISIMGIISTLVIVGFNRTQGRRNLQIAQNELVTNIRKVQGYVLSSRSLPNGDKAKVYLMRFESGSNSYTIGAVSENGNEFFSDLETATLPNRINFSRMRVVGDSTVASDCAYLIFTTPYGKMYVDYTAPCDAGIVDIVIDPAQLITRSDRQLDLVFEESQNQTERAVKIQTLSNTIREEAPYQTNSGDEGTKDGESR